ncbi:putative ribonuclease H-like domain-containing protein, partial [Tanacetum coccineum]
MRVLHETSEILCNLIIGLENQLSHNVKIIRCDNETEFKNHAMNEFCTKKGIKIEFSVARTPKQNGVAERKNRTLIEAARTMSSVSTATTPFVSAASTPTGANAGESSFVYLGGKIPIHASTLPNVDLPIDPNMPDLEDDFDAFSN